MHSEKREIHLLCAERWIVELTESFNIAYIVHNIAWYWLYIKPNSCTKICNIHHSYAFRHFYYAPSGSTKQLLLLLNIFRTGLSNTYYNESDTTSCEMLCNELKINNNRVVQTDDGTIEASKSVGLMTIMWIIIHSLMHKVGFMYS